MFHFDFDFEMRLDPRILYATIDFDMIVVEYECVCVNEQIIINWRMVAVNPKKIINSQNKQ